jgi:hypothetical protein
LINRIIGIVGIICHVIGDIQITVAMVILDVIGNVAIGTIIGTVNI